jgi:hypothetical protein
MSDTHLVEFRLVLTGCEAMDGIPGCATALHPHGRVQTLSAVMRKPFATNLLKFEW